MHDVIRLFNGGAFTVHDEPITIDAQGNRKSVFKGREILIELSEQTEVIVETA
jgi:hypothetical protein